MARNENGKRFSLKDYLFNKDKVRWLADHFKKADPKFDDTRFVREVMKSLPELELKQRIVHMAVVLEGHLDADFKKAAAQILVALPPELDPEKTDDDFGDFMIAPLGEYVVRNGLSKKHLKTSLHVLKELTKRFSMEDAIRYFINEFPEETMSELTKWTRDANYHVRRLTTEGTRPLLPWSGRISIPVSDPLPILDVLHADQTRYVTRSVANHLNDIAKIEPEKVISLLKKWHKEMRQNKKELDWMTRHALRTLIKKGNKDALVLLGYRINPKIEVSELSLSAKKLLRGEVLEFSFAVRAHKDEQLMIDYVIDFVKANGATKPKVHKLKQLTLKSGEEKTVSKKHRFLSDATTFTLHPGKHTLTLQINGQMFSSAAFVLQ